MVIVPFYLPKMVKQPEAMLFSVWVETTCSAYDVAGEKHTDSSYFTLDGSMLHFGELYSNNVDAEDANKLRNTGENISIAKAILNSCWNVMH